MKIVIDRYGKGNRRWSADWVELPGSPKLGFGRTQTLAVADLFFQCLRDEWPKSALKKAVEEGKEIVITRKEN